GCLLLAGVDWWMVCVFMLLFRRGTSKTSQQHTRLFGPVAVKRYRLLQEMFCLVPISDLQGDCARVGEKLGILDSERQRLLDLLPRFGVLSAEVQCPRVRVEGIDIVTPRELLSSNFKCLCRLMRMVCVIKDELTA